MSFSKKSMVLYIFLVSLALAPIYLTSCFLDSKKKSGKKSGGQPLELILRDSIFFDRLSDRTSARISFKTKVPIQCVLSYVQQDLPQDQVSKNRSPERPCSAQQPGSLEISEKLTGLDPQKFYYVIITAKSTQNPNDTDTLTVREPGAPASSNPPGTPANNTHPPSQQQSDSGILTELFVGRIDLVLKSGEVFRHVFKNPLSADQIRNEFKPEIGCFDQSKSNLYPFRNQTQDPVITQLATRDLGIANITTRPELPGILILDYPNINDGIDKWTFMYKIKNQDFIYSSRPIIRFSKVQISSNLTYDLDYPNLEETLEPMKIDGKRDLILQWTVPPQTPASAYIHVQIGRPTLQKSVYCAFQADQRKGQIGSQFLSNLESGRHVISVGLASVIFSPKEKWITTSYDWRSGRIEK